MTRREVLAVGMVILLVVGVLAAAVPSPALAAQTPDVKWTHNHHSDIVEGIDATSEVVYSVSVDQRVIAADAGDGSKLWNHSHHTDPIRAIDVVNGTVYSGGDDRVVSANASNGAELWNHTLHDVNLLDLDMAGGIVFSAGSAGELVAADASNGDELWTSSEHHGSGYAPISVAATDTRVFTGGNDEEVIAADASDGSIVWAHSHHSAAVYAVAVANGVVYSGDANGTLVAADASDGSLLWKTDKLHSDKINDLHVSESEGVIYTASLDQTTVAADTSNGSELWTFDDGNNIFSVSERNGVVYISTDSTSVVALNDTVQRGATVSGQVVDGDGTAFENARVDLLNDSFERVDTTTTDANGSFNFSGVEDGDYLVEAYADGYQGDSASITVNGSDVTGLQLQLKREYEVTGTVTDQDGNPIEGVEVAATFSTVDETDSQGRYSINLTEGTYDLTADKSGWTSKIRTITVNGTTTEDFTLNRSGAPYVTNPSPRNTYRANRSVYLQATVQHPENDPIDAEVYWYNGSSYELVRNVTGLSSGETVVAGPIDSRQGPNYWKVALTDGINSRTTDPFEYRTPAQIQVYDQTDLTKIDGGDVTIVGTDSNYRETTTVSNGVIDLEGMPDEDLLVRINKSGYRPRRIVVDDPTVEQYTLLAPESDDPANDTTIDWQFSLTDRTGNFDTGPTYLVIQQYYLGEYRTVGSDYFGAGNLAEVTLEENQEYRLTVRNGDTGDTRQLGQFIADPGRHSIPTELIVRETDGGDVEDSNESPVARFDYSPSAPETGTPVVVDATNSSDADGDIVAYRWRFKGSLGWDATGPKQQYTYPSGGNYTITLEVEDDDGNTDTVSRRLYVASTGKPPVARYSINESKLVVGEQITFSANASEALDPNASITDYDWQVSDGRSYSTEDITINFESAGNYTLDLTVSDSKGRTDTTSRTFYVGNDSQDAIGQPTAAFDFSPSNPAAEETVTFNGSASSAAVGSIDRYRWDVDGDGSWDLTGETVTHEYLTNGTYRATLEVTDSNGQINQTTQVVTVGAGEPDAPPNEAPVARVDVTPENPAPGEQVALNASRSADPDGNITSYRWDLNGDGEVDERGAVTDTSFASDGVYAVRLTVEDDRGTTDVRTVEITVGDGEPISSTYQWDVQYFPAGDRTGEATIRFSFQVADSTTVEDFRLRIYEFGNEDNVIYNETYGTTGSFTYRHILTGAQTNTTWVVAWSAEINGEQQSGSRRVGSAETRQPYDFGQWGAILGMVALTILTALYSYRMAAIGSVVLVGFAGMMMVFEMVTIPVAAWWVAAFVSVGSMIGAKQEGEI